MKAKEISDLIRRAPNANLCRKILLYLGDMQDIDGFSFRELKKRTRAGSNSLMKNLDYMKDIEILNENYHATIYTLRYIQDFLTR